MSEDFVADPPSTEELQKEGIEYDRRQIRRKLRERLQERGEDLEDEQDIGAREDEVSVYEDTEFFPWKQREAAVEAAALGGKTEGRMEGFDSLERALQAHTHKLHYGRGRAFGWSNQKQHSGSMGERGKSLFGSKTQLTDWTSFRDLSIAHENSGETKVATVETKQAQLDEAQRNRMKDIKAMKTQKRNSNILKTIYIVSAIGVCLGFAYYIEKLKIDNYQNYLPEGYIEQATVATNTGSGNDPSRHLEPGQARQIKSFEMATAGRDAKFIAVRDVLAFKWSDRNDLDREGTPQYNAAYWLCYHDMMNLGIPNSKAESDHLVQRFALATLYFATGGNEWSFADHFMTGLHECDWNVLDDKDKTQFGASHCESGKVTRLVLNSNNLQGILPKEIGLLTSLKTLDLRGNMLHGELPESFAALKALQLVSLQGNSLIGNVDPIICGLELQHVAMNCRTPILLCNCCHVCCDDTDKCVRSVVALRNSEIH